MVIKGDPVCVRGYYPATQCQGSLQLRQFPEGCGEVRRGSPTLQGSSSVCSIYSMNEFTGCYGNDNIHTYTSMCVFPFVPPVRSEGVWRTSSFSQVVSWSCQLSQQPGHPFGGRRGGVPPADGCSAQPSALQGLLQSWQPPRVGGGGCMWCACDVHVICMWCASNYVLLLLLSSPSLPSFPSPPLPPLFLQLNFFSILFSSVVAWFRKQGKHEEAIHAFEKSLKWASSCVFSLLNHHSTQHLLSRCWRIDDSFADTWSSYGGALTKLGHCKEAVAALQKVHSTSADVYSNTAAFLQLCGGLVASWLYKWPSLPKNKVYWWST